MKSFPKRLLLFFSGLGGCAVCATALTAVVEYKPWGVPDSRRAQYDARISEIDHLATLHDRYSNASRPIAVAPNVTQLVGLQDPDSNGSHQFEIRNDGSETLVLSVGSSHTCDTSLDLSQVPPGESTLATVSWCTGNEPVDFEHHVTIKTSDPLKEEIPFKIVGKTKAALVVPESTSFAVSDPVQRTEGAFVVYSQTWKEFKIVDVTSDLNVFDWYAEPMDDRDPELREINATSGWKVRIWTTPIEYGHYSGKLSVSVETHEGEILKRELVVQGRVRPPIIFHSPELHMTDGLDVGTRYSGTEYQFHILVRLRGELDRKIEVLSVQPSELKASLTPQSTPGNYKLTLSIPSDCPMTVFNIPEKHGFVEVGDPSDKQFKNWFPIHGAVVPALKDGSRH